MDLFTSQTVSFWVWKSGRVLTYSFNLFFLKQVVIRNHKKKPYSNFDFVKVRCWKERYISEVPLPYEEITKIIKLIVHIEKLKSDFDKIEVLLNYRQVF